LTIHFGSRDIREAEVGKTIQAKIDFVTKMPEGGYKLVLVEMGPWPAAEKDQNLQRLGQRICDCVTAVINGIITQRYPALAGEAIRIQVDSYSTPRWDVETLLAKLQNMVNTSPEIQQELKSGRYTSSILITHRWVDFDAEYARREAAQKRGLWQRLKDLSGQKR
jgi:hypothetical protein